MYSEGTLSNLGLPVDFHFVLPGTNLHKQVAKGNLIIFFTKNAEAWFPWGPQKENLE